MSVLSVLFYWLNWSLDSIKMMCDNKQTAKLQCSMYPPPFLITALRRRRHSLILLSMKRCEFLPLGDYRSLHFFHRLELSLVVDSLLKSIPNSVIHGINIGAIRRPHVRFNEVDVLFFSDSSLWSGRCALALHPAAVSSCNDDIVLMSGNRPFSRTILQ